MVGLEQVDRSVIEAGRGMGLTKRQALRHIELPLAVPVILAGVRTALVITVGMAALAFLIGGGGLGDTISAGLKLSRDLVLITGAVDDRAGCVVGRLDRRADREDAPADRVCDLAFRARLLRRVLEPNTEHRP